MDESENKTKGNSQKRENFWKKVIATWHNVMGFDAEYCTYHQLNSKWKDMCIKLTKFSGIYSNCANNRKKRDERRERVEMGRKGISTKEQRPNDDEEAEFDTPRNRLDRQVEIQQNGLPLQVVKPYPLTQQQPISLINSKLSQLFKNKNTRIGKKCTKKKLQIQEENTLRADLRAMESLHPEMLDDEDREIMIKLKKKLFDKYR
ncbi:hypothetical protein R6Q59_001519 [Mikania micrantha]|uniref:No apical meristem-associated C-terminal domain-containing protein n=1 Tax=Mikania micrantha TaxID=192012 RepID=A0A5N6NN91_9ASTR|nr:hypothetical protein E3N88_18474 [Mikania micrantha]